MEDEDEDDQEETEVGWHVEREGAKKERARKRERGTERHKEREKMRSGPHVGDVQYCSNDAEAAPLATIFSLYLLGIHLVLYSGLLHFIPASPPCPLSLSLSLGFSSSRCALAPFARTHNRTGTRSKKVFFHRICEGRRWTVKAFFFSRGALTRLSMKQVVLD